MQKGGNNGKRGMVFPGGEQVSLSEEVTPSGWGFVFLNQNLDSVHPKNSLRTNVKMSSIGQQCCQAAEISAKKLIRGRKKIKLAGKSCGRILAEFYQKWQKRGPGNIFERSSLFNGTDTLSEAKKN
jgi:hypothetical protein